MKKNLLFLSLTAFLMILLPLFSVLWAGMNAMAICLILFFAINPIYSVGVGIFAGRDIKKRWWQPIATALFFLIGVWAFFDMGETAFLWYALIYLLLGTISMGITKAIKEQVK